jgi:excinuclease ABC subunit C
MLSRRFKHREILPDLILIDGGKGHLNAALSILESIGLTIPTVALAKQEEDLYFKDGINPEMNPHSKNLLIRVRDEAHRFAIKSMRNMKRKSSMNSPLDSISGLGPKRKAKLFEKFGTIEKIKKAKIEEIDEVIKNLSLSEAIFNYVKTLK